MTGSNPGAAGRPQSNARGGRRAITEALVAGGITEDNLEEALLAAARDFDAPAEDDEAVEAIADRIWGLKSEPWRFVRLVRQPSAHGVAMMTIRHPEKGSVVVPLWRDDLRTMAIAALEAMEPD